MDENEKTKVDELTEKAVKVAGDMKDKAVELRANMEPRLKDAMERAKPLLDDVKGKAKDIRDNAPEYLEKAAYKAGELAGKLSKEFRKQKVHFEQGKRDYLENQKHQGSEALTDETEQK
jgi:ElaB/YqjD/DUF883 family membrane-anchored ribosome-binding protein